PDVTNINSYLSNRYNHRVFAGTDKYQGAVVNIKKQFNGPVPSWIKAGLRVRKQDRNLFNDQYSWNYIGPDGVMGINPATGRNDDNLAQFVQPGIIRWGKLDRYALLPWLTRPGADTYYDTYDYSGYNFATALREHPQYFREDVALSTMTKLNNRQQFQETINAGYLMGNVELGKLRVLGGLRVEETKVEAEGAKNEITPAEAALRAAFVGPLTEAEIRRRNTAQYSGRLTAAGDYRKIFPGLHFKYEPIRGLLARLGYSTNIGRPPIGTLIPRTTINNETRAISSSNPSLKPQTADNFDLGVEYYFEPAGLISATVFLKEMKQFIFTKGGQIVGAGPDNGFGGDYVAYTLTSQSNGGQARVRGFELAYHQQFTFLRGFWKAFGAYANYARNDTYGDYGGAIATTKVAGFVPETANAGISYIRNPLSIRFQFNYSSRRLVLVAPTPARLLYERARSALDLKSVYKFSKNYSFFLDVTNLNSAEERAREFEGGRRGLNYNTGPLLLTGINANY
ncbi:MAG: TonB-dependent receptor, partial [Verrucomicrobia bacterium]|nr:TonB-dependent receptor [Verrucomicrobiota bacterium]